ncbi:MAG: DUF2281 domain-containing protein [Saprospiraceae bacterium]
MNAMDTLALYSKIELLPEHLKKQVLDYIEFLLSREGKGQLLQQQPETPGFKAKPGFGGAKGMFVMSPDFDEPLEDFKEYM